MKRGRILIGILTMILSAAFSLPVFGAVYRRTKERYPEGEFMIIFESEGNGSYALGVDDGEWVLRPLYDITAVSNEDSGFLFEFISRSSDQKWVSSERLWNLNHSMAIRCKGGYLDFDSTDVDFYHSKPYVSIEPQYHWQYIDRSDSGEGNYLKFKGSYETAGKDGAIWAKANAEKTVLVLTTSGKGSNVYLYQESVGEEIPASSKGGWQEYTNGYQQHGWKYINPDGTLKQDEWHEEDGEYFYLGSDGVTLFGFHQLPDGKYYYFRPNGSLLRNSEISVEGVPYRIDKNGVCHKVSDKTPERTRINTPQYAKDDELINWINLKRAELNLPALHRDNRLAAMAEDIVNLDADLSDWQILDDIADDSGVEFKRQASLKMNWNEKIRRLSLETYYKKGSFQQLVNDPKLNHIGVYSEEKSTGKTREVLIIVGYYN